MPLASITFVTPNAALVGLVALVPLGVLAFAEARARRVCRILGLPGPGPRQWFGMAVALALTGGLLALAVAQPVLARQRTVLGRSDAEVYVVFDVSLSMGARARRGSPTRLGRARAFALDLRTRLADIPVGIASLSDRLLPHLFPTPSVNSFAATVDRSLAPGRPPTQLSWLNSLGTQLEVVGNLATGNFFDPGAQRRYAIVLTDGESLPTGIAVLSSELRRGNVRLAFARFWGADERVFVDGAADPAYRSDPGSTSRFAALAARLGAPVFGERDAAAAAAAVRAALGRGKDAPRGRELQSFQLGPIVAAVALLPILFVLLRRNVPPGAWRRLPRPLGRRRVPVAAGVARGEGPGPATP